MDDELTQHCGSFVALSSVPKDKFPQILELIN
jgi:hypothetical protein